MEHRTEDQCNVAIQQVLPVGNVPLHHGGSRGLMSCDNVGRGGEGGRGMPFGGVSRTDLRLTTALLTSSSSASSSAESQSIAWRAPSWVTSSRTVRSAGVSARARSSFALSRPANTTSLGSPAAGQSPADARARPTDESLTADAKRAGRDPGARRPPPFDNPGRPRRAGSARAGHLAPVTTHSKATARSLMGLYRSPATSQLRAHLVAESQEVSKSLPGLGEECRTRAHAGVESRAA
jgi:hypothetical protein